MGNSAWDLALILILGLGGSAQHSIIRFFGSITDSAELLALSRPRRRGRAREGKVGRDPER
jgi:hypothetical protein